MVFDHEEALKGLGGDQQLLLETLQDFIDFYGNSGEKIRVALAEERFDDAEILAHTLKGLGGTFAASTLRDAALSLEQSVRVREVEMLEQKAAELDHAISDMVVYITKLLHT